MAYALAVLGAVAIANPVVAEDGSSGEFIWPTTGRVTQPFGCTGFYYEPRQGSCAHFHGGIDIADSRGTPIRASADGVITHVGWDQWGTRNWMVIINHGGGLTTWYAHMRGKKMTDIQKGVRVQQGDVVGYMDTTGMSTGVHLHWAVLKDGSYANPRDYVDGLPSGPRKNGQPGAAACEVWIANVASGATAVVLEGDDGGGGMDAICAA
jgi:murein DD-endopeptidase MepM/ murein hydrolase activator NlpD